MVKDVEQFAYSVASELTWIDVQMEEIMKDDGEYVSSISKPLDDY
jgi:hypothetical protein